MPNPRELYAAVSAVSAVSALSALWKEPVPSPPKEGLRGLAVVVETPTLTIPLDPPSQRGKRGFEITCQTKIVNFNKPLRVKKCRFTH